MQLVFANWFKLIVSHSLYIAIGVDLPMVDGLRTKLGVVRLAVARAGGEYRRAVGGVWAQPLGTTPVETLGLVK